MERDLYAPTMDSIEPPLLPEQKPVHTSFVVPVAESTSDNNCNDELLAHMVDHADSECDELLP